MNPLRYCAFGFGLWSLLAPAAWAFGVAPRPQRAVVRPTHRASSVDGSGNNWSSDGANGGGIGGIERLEFKIYADGRVEETVRGIKGNQCSKVTEVINEKLGKVVQTAPTEEMFEQALVNDQALYDTYGNDASSSSSSTW